MNELYFDSTTQDGRNDSYGYDPTSDDSDLENTEDIDMEEEIGI
jgi:hypothetical protein